MTHKGYPIEYSNCYIIRNCIKKGTYINAQGLETRDIAKKTIAKLKEAFDYEENKGNIINKK